jgi:hypothetical protein
MSLPDITMVGMKLSPDYRVSGPHNFETLSLYLIQANDRLPSGAYEVLEKAMEKKTTVVHETGNVGELLIENLGETDVFVQAGDILKGGRQDRMIQVDFVISKAMGRMPLPTFCVEQGRWSRRGRENVSAFSGSKSYVSSKHMKFAARMEPSQHKVWEAVEKAQSELSSSIQENVTSAASPSSYQLARENAKILSLLKDARQHLHPLAQQHTDAVGLVFATNGELNSADVYASHDLFLGLWDKLLEAAITEAIASAREKRKDSAVPDEKAVRDFLDTAHLQALKEDTVTPRVRVRQFKGERLARFETDDLANAETCVHASVFSF